MSRTPFVHIRIYTHSATNGKKRTPSSTSFVLKIHSTANESIQFLYRLSCYCLYVYSRVHSASYLEVMCLYMCISDEFVYVCVGDSESQADERDSPKENEWIKEVNEKRLCLSWGDARESLWFDWQEMILFACNLRFLNVCVCVFEWTNASFSENSLHIHFFIFSVSLFVHRFCNNTYITKRAKSSINCNRNGCSLDSLSHWFECITSGFFCSF